MDEVTKYTVDYLRYMRAEVAKVLDDDGSLQDAYAIDQSAYAHLDTFDELARLNAGPNLPCHGVRVTLHGHDFRSISSEHSWKQPYI